MQIEGYQDEHIKRNRAAWIPSLPQTLLYLFLALFITVLFNRTLLIGWLGGETLDKLGGIGYITHGENYYLSSLFAIPVLGTIAVIVFWGALGCTLYCLAWGFTNTLKEVKKYDEAANESVMPSGFSKQKFWESTAANIVLLISSVFVGILLIMLAATFALPATEQLLTLVLSNILSFDALLAFGLFVGGSILIGHGFYLAVHTFNYARRVVFFD